MVSAISAPLEEGHLLGEIVHLLAVAGIRDVVIEFCGDCAGLDAGDADVVLLPDLHAQTVAAAEILKR